MSCVSLSDPTCRDGNVQFTSISLKALPDQVLINNINVYNIEKSGFPTKSDLRISTTGKHKRSLNSKTYKSDNVFHIIDQIKFSRLSL